MRDFARRVGAVCALALAVAACASAGPAVYQAANEDRFGYSDQRIEAGRYRVRYVGSAGVSVAEVRDLALRRAAELTRSEGADWFRIVGENVAIEERGGVGLGLGVGGGSFGRRGGVGVGVGGDVGRVGARDFATVDLEILTGAGERPQTEGLPDRDVYDARSVLETAEGRDFAQ